MKKIILVSSAILLLVISYLIFGTRENNTEKTKIVVAEVTHSVFYAPWYAALENGYFEQEGLEIEVILTPGADKVAASVLSGDAQIGFSGPEATIYVYNNSKEKLVTFASLTKRDGQFIVGDCSLKEKFTMNDLKGKTILAGRNAGMPLMMFEYALYKSNMTREDVNIDSSVEFAGLSGAFIAKQGDFVNLFEPNALNLEKNNYGCVLASLGNISGVVPYTAYYASEEYINNNKSTIQKFNNALNKGLTYVKNNDNEKIAKSIINQFPDTDIDDLISIVKRYKDADSWYENTYVSPKDYNNLMEIMIYGKAIDKKINSSELITNEFNK